MGRMNLSLLIIVQFVFGLPSSYASQNRKVSEFNIEINSPKHSVKIDSLQEREVANAILYFYKAYATDHTPAYEDALMTKYLTKEMIGKVARVGASTGADPIIRAQDISDDMVKSLSVNYLGDNWYMVNYKGDKQVNIPVRVVLIDGRYMIDYITPPWNNSLYGDSLLCEHPVYPVVAHSNPLSFLKTFYEMYTLKYAAMPADLTDQLAGLRAEYLSPNALAQFKAASDEQKLDGLHGYDLLVDDFDFDNLWRSSIKVTPLEENTYQISYNKWRTIQPKITIKLVKQGEKYIVDSIVKD